MLNAWLFSWFGKFERMPDPAPAPRRPIRSTGLPIFDDVLDEAGIEEPYPALTAAEVLAETDRLRRLADDTLGPESLQSAIARTADAFRVLTCEFAGVTS